MGVGGEQHFFDDEAFWREQEGRKQDLGQPCCTQAAICWGLADLEGDLAVVVHGEGDCLNSFFHYLGRSTASFYSTRLSDEQLISGGTAAPLRHLLELLARERRPEAVLVLGTCPVEMIGDSFEAVVEEVSRRSGVPMVALHTHGLSLTSQAQCQDWLYETLAAGLPQLEEPPTASCNFLGLPCALRHAELEGVVGELGMTVHGYYPNGTSLRAWRTISHAETTFVVDREMFPRVLSRLDGWGQRLVFVPMPVGLGRTAAFYRAVAEAYDGTRRIEPTLVSLRAKLEASHQETAARARGRRLAICLRTLKSHRSDRIAFAGLGELPFYEELGFDCHLFVQGPPEAAAREQFRERLEMLGHGGVSFEIFPGPRELGVRLAEERFEVAVMSDAVRNVVERVGLAMIPTGALRPFYAGMGGNLELVDRVLEGRP
jgi:hypothetical protein